MPRPSGTRHKPPRASASGPRFTTSPPNRTSPEVGAICAAATFNVVDFPAPFGPEQRVHAARVATRGRCRTGRRSPRSRRRRHGARGAARPRPAPPRRCRDRAPRRPRRRRPRPGSRRSASASASTGAPSPTSAPAPAPRYAARTAGSACTSAGVPTAMMRPKSSTWMREQVPITNPMSCSTRSTARPSSARERSSAPSSVRLTLVEARRRLVEQQQARLRRERARDLDEPRGPGGQACRRARRRRRRGRCDRSSRR